jgi:hypothetical protein
MDISLKNQIDKKYIYRKYYYILCLNIILFVLISIIYFLLLNIKFLSDNVDYKTTTSHISM